MTEWERASMRSRAWMGHMKRVAEGVFQYIPWAYLLLCSMNRIVRIFLRFFPYAKKNNNQHTPPTAHTHYTPNPNTYLKLDQNHRGIYKETWANAADKLKSLKGECKNILFLFWMEFSAWNQWDNLWKSKLFTAFLWILLILIQFWPFAEHLHPNEWQSKTLTQQMSLISSRDKDFIIHSFVRSAILHGLHTLCPTLTLSHTKW